MALNKASNVMLKVTMRDLKSVPQSS